MDSQQVEKVARVMWAAETGKPESCWEDEYVVLSYREGLRESARHALRAHSVRHLLNEMAAGVE